MPSIVTVCDTNCYRKIPPSDWERLREHEAKAGIVPMVNFWSTMELAAHLLDSDPRTVTVCHRALKSLWTHCRMPVDDQEDLPFAGDSESQLALTLFGIVPPGRIAEASLYGYAIRRLAADDRDQAIADVHDILLGLRRHRDATEADFVADMQRVVALIDPSAPGWLPFARSEDAQKRRDFLTRIRSKEGHPYMAEALVRKAADLVGVHVNDEAVRARTHYVLTNFPTPIFFYDSLLEKMVESGIDFTRDKHANSIWDLQLCFYALPDATVADAPVVLVTDEGAIRAAAVRAGARGRVFSSSDYHRRVLEERLTIPSCGAA